MIFNSHLERNLGKGQPVVQDQIRACFHTNGICARLGAVKFRSVYGEFIRIIGRRYLVIDHIAAVFSVIVLQGDLQSGEIQILSNTIGQLLRLVIKDIQGIGAERGDNVLCRLGADAFDKPGAQVSQQAVRCLRYDFLPLLDLQLVPVLALHPLAIQFQLHRLGAGQFVPHRRKAQHTVAVVAAAASLRRDARVTGLDNDDGEFVCFIVKNRGFVGNTAAGNAAVFLFTVVHRHAPFFVRRLHPPLLP